MIVEFFGIPGCGKTYCANKYKEKLKKEGVPYFDFSRCHSSPFFIKLTNILFDIAVRFLPKYRKITKEYLKLYDKKKKSVPKHLPFSINYCISRITASLFLHNLFAKTKIQIINDEGMIQWICFLSIQYEISIDSILNIQSPFGNGICNWFVEKSVNQSMENIKKRNRHDCEMDNLDNYSLQSYLEDFYLACKSVEAKGAIKYVS